MNKYSKLMQELLYRTGYIKYLIETRKDDNELYLLDLDSSHFQPVEIPFDIDSKGREVIEGFNKSLKTVIKLRDEQKKASESTWYAWDHLLKITEKFEAHTKAKHDCSDECLKKAGFDREKSKEAMKKVLEFTLEHLKGRE